MTNAAYRAYPAISKSDLFRLQKSPDHFRYAIDHPSAQTASMLFGSAFHKYVLEPETFFTEFAVAPDIERRTKAGKEQWQAFQATESKKDIITQESFETIQAMSKSIYKNKYAAALLSGQKEQSFFWTDDVTGEPCKCRPDAMVSLGDTYILSDLKTCESAKTEDFMRDAIKYGYPLQAYMYTTGVAENTRKTYQFVFIAVEKKPPYAVNILQADDVFILYGEDQFRDLMEIYADCKETGKWYGYNGARGTINSLTLPPYLRREYVDE